MTRLFHNTAFNLGFLSGILIFAVINVYSAITNWGGLCIDCYKTFGFSFAFALYDSGTILHLDQALWVGVIADILIALIFSFVIGLIFNFVWSKIALRRLPLK